MSKNLIIPKDPISVNNITLNFCNHKDCHGYRVSSPAGLAYHHISLEHLVHHFDVCPDKIIKPANIKGKSKMDEYDSDYHVYGEFIDKRKIHLGSAFIQVSYPFGNGLYFEFKVEDLVERSPGVKFMNFRVWEEILLHNYRIHQSRLFYQQYWSSKKDNIEILVDELDLKLAQRTYYVTDYSRKQLDKITLPCPSIDARVHRDIITKVKKEDKEFFNASWCWHKKY